MFLCEPLQAECEGGFFMSFFANRVDDGYGTMIYELTTAGYVALFVFYEFFCYC